MVLGESVINTFNPRDLSALRIKYEQILEDGKVISFEKYLMLVIVYMNYIFKLQEMRKENAPDEEIDAIKRKLKKYEDDYYMGYGYSYEL